MVNGRAAYESDLSVTISHHHSTARFSLADANIDAAISVSVKRGCSGSFRQISRLTNRFDSHCLRLLHRDVHPARRDRVVSQFGIIDTTGLSGGKSCWWLPTVGNRQWMPPPCAVELHVCRVAAHGAAAETSISHEIIQITSSQETSFTQRESPPHEAVASFSTNATWW